MYRRRGRWPRMEPPFDDVDEQYRSEEVPEELVEERGVVGRLIDRRERPVDGVDLEPPREIGRLPEELLVPPVPDPPDSLGDEQAGCEAVGEEPHVGAGPLGDQAADETSRGDPAPHSEAALPDREGPHHWSGTSSQLVAR